MASMAPGIALKKTTGEKQNRRFHSRKLRDGNLRENFHAFIFHFCSSLPAI